MTTIINANTSAGLTQTADTSGIVKLQSNGVTTNAIAWVKFVGATGAISASYNVSSITRVTTGQYTVTFASALADANYTYAVNMFGLAGANGYFTGTGVLPTTTAFGMYTITSGIAYADPTAVVVTFFGD
jgi:hypothetical protein